MERFDAQVLAYCLMGNHYHLVLHTRSANLSRLMRHLNGVFTQRFNRRHGVIGHLLQGRFKAVIVDRDAYLLTLCRYVERNPVAAGLVADAQAWPWSSCRAHLGQAPVPAWLDTDGLHGYLLAGPVQDGRSRRTAIARYAELLQQPVDAGLWTSGLRQQVFLGDDAFVERTQALVPAGRLRAAEVPLQQRRRPAMPKTLAQQLQSGVARGEALRVAYTEAGMTMTQLAREAGLSVSSVSRLIAAAEAKAKGKT